MKPSTQNNKLYTRRGAPRAVLALLLAAAMLPVVFFSGSDGIIAAPDGFSGSISGYVRSYVEPGDEVGGDDGSVEEVAEPPEVEPPEIEPPEDAEPSNGPADGELSEPPEETEPSEAPEGETPAETAEEAEPAEIEEDSEPPDEDAEPTEIPEEVAEPIETPEDSEPAEGPAPVVPEEVQADSGETGQPPLPGYTVYLYRADDLSEPIDTAVTGADGKYTFTGLEPGAYRVGIPLLADGGTLYQLADGGDGGFEAGAPVAFSRALELTEGAMELENVSALLKVSQEQPMPEDEEEEEELMTLSASAPIDLSHDYGATSGDGYTITGSGPSQKLTITSNEGGPYTIIQSNYTSCRFMNIVVNSGVTAQITIIGINIKSGSPGTPPFALQDSANVKLVIENNMAGGHNMLTHTYKNTTSANCAALYVPVSASLTIDGDGKLEATGGQYGAGIGGGGDGRYTTTTSAGTITISGGTVEAWGTNAAGIGGSYNERNQDGGKADGGHSGKITIEGGTVTAHGGHYSAGIGYGRYGRAVNPADAANDQFNSITITSGTVTAKGGQYGAGIGGAYGCGGGRITITGGIVVAEGGDGTCGAGIGGGYTGRGGVITISGDADVTATGGSGNDSDGAESYPGIGGYSDGANNTYLTLDHTATVKAYAGAPLVSGARPAIFTGLDPISGTGYFVNAYFPSDVTGIPNGGDIRLDVYANGGSVVTNTLTLPARINDVKSTYRGFAYTTGAQTWQNDRIYAYAADGSGLGSVVNYTGGSPDIGSYNDRTNLKVKFGGPNAGLLTLDEIYYNTVRLYCTGYSLGGYTYIDGGFRYSTSPDMAGAVNEPWQVSELNEIYPVDRYIFNLKSDTVYYAQAYIQTNFASGATVYSNIVEFKTLAFLAIDLSTRETNGPGYTVSGVSPYRTLNITADYASPYTIIQSGGNDPGTSIFRNIIVNSGLDVKITIRDINVQCLADNTPVFSVKASASAQTSVTLLLDGDNTLTQSATGAGNNAALSVSRPAVLTIDTAAGGGGSLTAKGGAGGAGIGGGDGGLSGQININGGDITAVGGAGTNGGAGIGGNGGSGAGISGSGAGPLTIASTASVKAYSQSADYPAIQAPRNSGNGFYVNAYFGEGEEPSVLTGAATRLNVYTENDQINAANTLELPNTYRSFAYATNKIVEQSDSIRAFDAASSVPLGFVARYDDGSPQIGSVKDPGTLLRVKFNSVAGTPSVTNIQKDGTGVASRADFTSTGHALPYGATLGEGGFRYSNSVNGATGALTGAIETKAWAEQTAASPKTETVEGLEPNTRYHMAAYLNIDIFGGTQNFTSGSVAFATLPYIESASAAAVPDDDTAALISADFYESSAENITIEGVTVYWDTKAIDAGAPEAADNSAVLAPAGFSDAGFTSYRLEGLAQGAVYNILIVIENESGTDSFALVYAAHSEINVSVPVKLIFAAFETDAGDVTSPTYHIKNHGNNVLDATVDGFDEINGAGLTLTQGAPGAGEIRLRLQGAGASLGIGMAGYLEDSDTIDEPLCTLQVSGTADDTYYFKLGGEYNGAFDIIKRPEYFLVLKFVLATPQG